jgi:hypothetical protein
MKKQFAYLLLITCISCTAFAQGKFPPLDKSPMDASYYPVNYPILRIQDKATEPLLARVVYSRPQRSGRNVFGELVEYGKVWRLGANEATEIEFYRDVKVNGTKLKKGRYTMYCIPEADKWTIILNKDTDIWGAFKYDAKKDLLRTVIPVQKQVESIEALTITFEKANGGANLLMAWDNVAAKLPITL